MKWNIVTDSSCDLFPTSLQNGEIQISSVPFIISVGNRDFVDDETLDTAELLDAMEHCAQSSHTSCPSPQNWLEQFEKADFCIALTISSRLSGSINSAVLAKEIVLEQDPTKKVAVLDSRSTGPELVICVKRICDLIEAGADFEKAVSEAEVLLRDTRIAFALSSFDNLVKSGRMSKVAGFVAGKLGMWGIGIGSDEGTISIKGRARGAAKAMAMLLDDMKERGFHGGEVVISHCHNFAFADRLKCKIQELWQDTTISIMPTRGLCSYYAERGGLIVSY